MRGIILKICVFVLKTGQEIFSDMTIDDIYTVIISLLLVFTVLAGICLFVYAVSALIRLFSRKKSAPVATPAADVPVAPATQEQAGGEDDTAIVAAIIAAITAYRQSKYGHAAASNFKVVSFKRTGAGR